MLGSARDVTMGEAGETAVMRAAQVATTSTARTRCMLPMSLSPSQHARTSCMVQRRPTPPPPPPGLPPPPLTPLLSLLPL